MCIEGVSSDSAWTKWKVIKNPNYPSVYINASLNVLSITGFLQSGNGQGKNNQGEGEVREFFFESGKK